jgi:hypothetical protein
MIDNIYSDPDAIKDLYSNPANVVLLTEYSIQTGSIQLGISSANMGDTNVLGAAGMVLQSTEVQGQGGAGGLPVGSGGGGRTPIYPDQGSNF